jgi:hypothetical protein
LKQKRREKSTIPQAQLLRRRKNQHPKIQILERKANKNNGISKIKQTLQEINEEERSHTTKERPKLSRNLAPVQERKEKGETGESTTLEGKEEEEKRSKSSGQIPTKVGPSFFQPLQLLGKGSFGEVYLVKTLLSDDLYAMKVLPKVNYTCIHFYFFILEKNYGTEFGEVC